MLIMARNQHSKARLDMQVFTCILWSNAKYMIMDETDSLFKALADPSRRMLLDLLYDNDGQTLGELCTHLAMTRQAVTQHLGLLEAANLITTDWRGREKLHYLNPVPLQIIYERWICKFDKKHLAALHALKKKLEDS
jgi:DNA-binding transcriptional ArsR family regulator